MEEEDSEEAAVAEASEVGVEAGAGGGALTRARPREWCPLETSHTPAKRI